MKTHTFFKTVIVAALIAASSILQGQTTYKLVTSSSELEAGHKYLIVGKNGDNYYVMGKRLSGNSYSAVSITVDDIEIITTPATDFTDNTSPYEIEIGGSAGAWTLYDELNDLYDDYGGFLRPADAASNGLRLTTEAVTWEISIATDGLATVIATDASTFPRGRLRYNYNNDIFSCYNNTSPYPQSNDVYLYKSEEEPSTAPRLFVTSPANNSTLTTSDVTVSFTTLNFDLGTDGKIKYFIDSEEADFTTENSINFSDLDDATYTVTVELVDMDEEALEPAVVKTVTFTVSTTVVEPENKSYILITSNSELEAGEKYILVGKLIDEEITEYYAMGYQKTSNRHAVIVTNEIDNTINVTTATSTSDQTSVYEITLEGSTGAWTIFDAVNNTYLKPRDGSTDNGLVGTETSLNTWSISIASDAVATITYNENLDRRDLRFNYSSTPPLFACYAPTNTSPTITRAFLYKSGIPSTEPKLFITSPANNSTLKTSDVTVSFTTPNFDLGTDGKVKYFIDGNEADFTTENSINFSDLDDATYTVTLELVDMDEEALETAVVRTVTFTVNTTGPVITPIRDIQYTENPNGDSPMNGQTVWVEGIVTFIQKNFNTGAVEGYYIQDDVARWSGIYVYNNVNPVELGSNVRMQAKVSEYYGLTELTNVTDFEITGYSSVPEPMLVTCEEAGTEAYESCYVALCGFKVTGSGSYGNLSVSDNSGTFTVNKSYQIKDKTITVGSIYSVKGIINYNNLFRLMPDALNDGNDCFVSINIGKLDNMNIYPNPVNNVLRIELNEIADNISILNILGQTVIEKKPSSLTETVNTCNLDKGIYIVKITKDNFVEIAKIVKE